jgi:arylformamidase
MKIYDVTLPILPEMPVWPGDSPVTLERVASMERGDSANVSRLACSAHTGTHVDAPVHFIADGTDVASLPLDALVGPASVVAVPDANAITSQMLDQLNLPRHVSRLLFKTRNSDRPRDRFREDFVALTSDAGEWVIQHGIRLVGVDGPSVEQFGGGVLMHLALLGAGVVILEGMDLRHVPPGNYTLYCLPLKLVGSDGSPARVILVAE